MASIKTTLSTCSWSLGLTGVTCCPINGEVGKWIAVKKSLPKSLSGFLLNLCQISDFV